MARKRKPPGRTKYRLDRHAGELFARWRTGTAAIGCFMLVWMSGWTAGCVLLAHLAWTERSVEALGGATVFWCGWFLGFVILVRQLFGRESIRLTAEGVRTTSSGLFRRTTEVPLGEIIGFGSVTDDRSGDAPEKRLDIRTVGRPLRIGEGLSGSEIATLADELRAVFKELRGSRESADGYPREAALVVFREKLPGELLAAATDKKVEVRGTGAWPIELPSDSRLRRRDGFDEVTIWRRGRFYLGGLIGAAVIAGFWNGIVGIFLHELFFGPPERRPVGVAWIWKFVLLIPFIVIGALMLVGILLLVLEPLRVWTRRFSKNEILDRLAWFGFIRFQTRYPLAGVDRIEVRRVAQESVKFPNRLSPATLWAPSGCPTYDVVPVDGQAKAVCRIEGLTFGEACWLADLLLRARTDWFR